MARISHTEAGGANVLAFLDTIGYSEGTTKHPLTRDDGYDVIVTGIDAKGHPTPEIFHDYSTHPFADGRKSKLITSRGLTSNASGRYQHMLKDWAHYRARLNLPDFGPLSQDRWALQLIRERRALEDIKFGRVEAAITKCSNIWASFPGNTYGQPMHKMSKLVAAFKAAGGTVA